MLSIVYQSEDLQLSIGWKLRSLSLALTRPQSESHTKVRVSVLVYLKGKGWGSDCGRLAFPDCLAYVNLPKWFCAQWLPRA